MAILLASIPESLISPERRAILESFSPGLTLLVTQDRKAMAAVIDDVEIALGNLPRDLVVRACRLKWYQQFGTGTEWLLDHPEALDMPFILTNCSDDYGIVLAEHTMALILAMARQLPEHFEAQMRKSWSTPDFNDPRRFELRGKTLLLLGVGSIGKAIAKRAQAFEMRICGLRRDPSRSVDGIDRLYGPDQLHQALSDAELVVNSLPLTRETRHLLDRKAIASMRPGACFFNIGRGATVDEAALAEALQEGRLAGAGLDVFGTEPLPSESPLWDLPNVIITPHDGGNHRERTELWMQTIFDNLRRYRDSQPLRNLVDKHRSY